MSFMNWNDDFITGIEIVDHQHHGLVDLVNTAAPALASKSTAKLADLEPVFAALMDYAAVHFKTEEDLMLQHGVDARVLGHHQKTHKQFVDQVVNMVGAFKSGQGVTGDELLSFLAGWLVFHILGEDQAMGRQIHAIERGLSPEQAFLEADGSHISPTPAAETHALVGLYTQLSLQNNELESHRNELENLVFERTLELEKLAVDLRESRDAAVAGNMAKSRFLGTMSHELKTPMNAILGYSKLLVNEGLPPDQKIIARKIVTASDHLLEIINDLIEYSRLDSGQREQLHKESFQFKTVLSDASQHLFAEAKAKGLGVRIDIDQTLPENLMGNARHIGKIIKQFVSNAIKFTERGGVQIVVKRAGNLDMQDLIPVRIAVRDTGIGIPPEAQAHLFGAFEQLDDRPERKYEGLGLGLALARQLAQHMGGEVGVESEPGKGSLFWLELKLAKAADAPATQPTAKPLSEIFSRPSSPPPAQSNAPTRSDPPAIVQPAEEPLPANFQVSLQHLDKLLGEFDTSAGKEFESLSSLLRRAFPDRFDELAGQVSGFEYDQAQRTLRELAKRQLH